MSRLTQLRQRIETVSKLQKTTHAMRLTSMSTHSALQKQKTFLSRYKDAIESIKKLLPTDQSKQNDRTSDSSTLVIIVGSQKGLCGAFNTRLMQLAKQSLQLKKYPKKYHIISVGKKITDYLEQRGIEPRASYNTFSAANFVAIAHEISTIITTSNTYTNVTLFSNQPRTFFVQESLATDLTVPQKNRSAEEHKSHNSEILVEEDPHELGLYLAQLHMKVAIQEILFNSLVAEHAARFVSMDSSTRNADQLLSDMKIDYNKLRQALITRELTDLAGGVI